MSFVLTRQLMECRSRRQGWLEKRGLAETGPRFPSIGDL